jgi:hypothetical protein
VDWCTGLSGVPPDSVWCTMSVRRWISHSRENVSALRYNSADCPVCHRTVRWVSGQRLPARNGRLCKGEQCSYSATQKSELKVRGAPDCPVWHGTVWCRKKTKLQRSTELRTLTIGWHGSAPNSEQDLSGGTPDCPGAPIDSSLPNGFFGGWGL